jgi:hypothetical protein
MGLITGPKSAVDYKIRFVDLGGAANQGEPWFLLNLVAAPNVFGALSL